MSEVRRQKKTQRGKLKVVGVNISVETHGKLLKIRKQLCHIHGFQFNMLQLMAHVVNSYPADQKLTTLTATGPMRTIKFTPPITAVLRHD